MNKIKLCKKCKEELLNELEYNLYWKMTYGLQGYKIRDEIIKMIRESKNE